MAKSYSIDLKKRVIVAYEQGQGSMRKTAKRFDVSLSFVNELWQRYKAENTLEAKPHAGGKVRRVQGETEESFLSALLKEKNDRTLEELLELFKQQFRKTLSPSTMHETLKRMNLTRKKKVSMTPNARVKPLPKEQCFIGKKS